MLRRWTLLLALITSACASADRDVLPRRELRMRDFVIGERRMNVTADLSDADVEAILRHFQTRLEADVFGVWSIPDATGRCVVFAEPPGQPRAYGPRVYVIARRAGSVDVLHATGQMMDTDFLHPAFFSDGDRVLMLADFGSEDSWGLVAMQAAPGEIRDYGTIDITGEEDLGFAASALPVAEVFVRGGRYVITFRGEVMESPGAGPTKWLARRGQRGVRGTERPLHIPRYRLIWAHSAPPDGPTDPAKPDACVDRLHHGFAGSANDQPQSAYVCVGPWPTGDVSPAPPVPPVPTAAPTCRRSSCAVRGWSAGGPLRAT